MIRDRKAPAGPRTETSSMTRDASATFNRPRYASREATRIDTAVMSHHAIPGMSATYDFFPSPSFDDLASSISVSQEQKAEIVGTRAEQSLDKGRVSSDRSSVSTNGSANGFSSRGSSLAPRPARNSSLVRRQSNSTRQTSLSSSTSGTSVTRDAPTAPLAMRSRRQSQHPPISTQNTTVNHRNVRKSLGSGAIELDTTRRPRASMLASTSSYGSLETDHAARNLHVPSVPSFMEGARALTTARAAKTKSLQPASRPAQALLSLDTHTPEHLRSAALNKARGGNTPNSASSKRSSMMPGHATGLGARTVSPTDARRAKRMSMAPAPPPLPNTPTTPHDNTTKDVAERMVARSPTKSPALALRIPQTPVSATSTPDLLRKAQAAGLMNITTSMGQSPSITSAGPFQPRLSSLGSSNRQSLTKVPSLQNLQGDEEEEYVPPVPAIPKAYESPKDVPADLPFSNRRKSNMNIDTTHSSTYVPTKPPQRSLPREPIKHDKDDAGPVDQTSSPLDDACMNTLPRKASRDTHLSSSMRLPPLHISPLTNIAAQRAEVVIETPTSNYTRVGTPPSQLGPSMTPSSPMTASKSSFFARRRTDEKAELPSQTRATTSIKQLRSPSPLPPASMSPHPGRQPVSPFLSSSLPKENDHHYQMPRSITTDGLSKHDWTTDTPDLEAEPLPEVKHSRLTGPRAQKLTKPRPTAEPQSSPEEPQAPSSGSSIRRKLSLSWRRSTSKASLSHQNTPSLASLEGEMPPHPPKHDNMPPPKFPASATMQNLSTSTQSPSPSIKTPNFLDSKRRKSSTSSLSMFGHDRTRSDSWGLSRSPKKEQTPEVDGHAGSRPPVPKMSKRPSTMGMRPKDRWTIDLDKDDLQAEEEMRKLGSKKKDIEHAARDLDALRRRAVPKDPMSIQQAVQQSGLNIYERGEVIDYSHVYFSGAPGAKKHNGDIAADTLNSGYDDERGDYQIVKGDHLAYRYEVIDVLGKGSFGQVVRCIDHKGGKLVAIKIIRNKKRFHAQALVEVNILKKLKEWDPQRQHSVINFVQSFYFRNHLCISTELLDANLYEWIKANSFRGFSLNIVRRMARQLLSTLMLLKEHKVIHCDLKPENILLSHPLHSEIKVIDFGSSCFENEKVYTYIQSRFYRSPEVILGMTYGLPIDMWSLGCILAEIYTGVPIFPGENELEQLACIMEVFGPPERHLIEKSSRRKLFFDSLGKPRINVSSKGRRRRPSSKTLQQAIKCEDDAFIDFLKQCLKWDPDKRLKADEALKHPFIMGQKMAAPASRLLRQESPLRRTNSIATTGMHSSSLRSQGFSDGKKSFEPARVFNRTIANFGNSVAAASASTMNKRNSIRIDENAHTKDLALDGDVAQFFDSSGMKASRGPGDRPLPEPPSDSNKIPLKAPISAFNTSTRSFGRRQSSLPEPVAENGASAKVNGSSTSPTKKPFDRRHSNVNGLQSSTSSKRASMGPPLPLGTSGLPRAARNISGPKQDSALAGATAAMASRRS